MAVLKRKTPDKFSLDTYADLEKIRAICDVCQREATAPHLFRVSLPYEDCVFNRVVSMDLMKVGGKTVLHVADRDSKFVPACFLSAESTTAVWEAILHIWV